MNRNFALLVGAAALAASTSFTYDLSALPEVDEPRLFYDGAGHSRHRRGKFKANQRKQRQR